VITDQKKIILFDGVCNLCNTGVKFVIRHDKKKIFQFASLQSQSARQLLHAYGLQTEVVQSFIFIDQEKIYERSSATLHVLAYLPAPWKFLYGLIIIPKFIRDWTYDIVAKNRYKWFGKKEACWIPTPELAERFLD
jgi:predicted DCC family thiol-disulfide oxidoreductase YuxK